MILNIPNDKFSKYMKQKLKELKEEIMKSIIKVEDLTSPLSQQLVRQQTKNQQGQRRSEQHTRPTGFSLQNIPPNKTRIDFFFNSCGTNVPLCQGICAKLKCLRIFHQNKAHPTPEEKNLNKFKRKDIILSIFSDHNRIKIGIRNRQQKVFKEIIKYIGLNEIQHIKI